MTGRVVVAADGKSRTVTTTATDSSGKKVRAPRSTTSSRRGQSAPPGVSAHAPARLPACRLCGAAEVASAWRRSKR